MLIETTQHDKSFGHQEKAIIEDIVNLPELRIRELMVPRVDLLLLRNDTTIEDAQKLIARDDQELATVYENDEDNIIGYVDLQSLFSAQDPSQLIEGLVKPIKFPLANIPENLGGKAFNTLFLLIPVLAIVISIFKNQESGSSEKGQNSSLQALFS